MTPGAASGCLAMNWEQWLLLSPWENQPMFPGARRLSFPADTHTENVSSPHASLFSGSLYEQEQRRHWGLFWSTAALGIRLFPSPAHDSERQGSQHQASAGFLGPWVPEDRSHTACLPEVGSLLGGVNDLWGGWSVERSVPAQLTLRAKVALFNHYSNHLSLIFPNAFHENYKPLALSEIFI